MKSKEGKSQPSGFVNTAIRPDWLEWLVPEKLNDHDLFRIVIFFVFHSPCTGSNPPSAMGKPVKEYGWSEKWGDYRNPKSLNNILRKASSNFSFIYPATGNNDMRQACENAGFLKDFPANFEKEAAAFTVNDQNQFLSLFRHIRNSFSHGRLNICESSNGDSIFVFEDVSPKSRNGEKDVSARMILRKSTLLKWIDIIERGPQSNSKDTK